MNNTTERQENQVSHKDFQQNLDNLPDELLSQPRFFEVGANKVPHLKNWSNPDKQKNYSDIQGLVGFDTSGHGIAPDYILFDFDHILDKAGKFINEEAERFFYYVSESLKSYSELSISKEGAHILAKASDNNNFPSICAGAKGTLYFDSAHTKDSPKLEIFYKTSARYCLVTGNLFCCEAKTPIASGEVVDSVLGTILAEIQQRLDSKSPTNPKSFMEQAVTINAHEVTTMNEFSENKLGDKTLPLGLPPNTKNGDTASPPSLPQLPKKFPQGTDYDLFRAELMLDAINPVDLADTEWLTVMSACKNIGVPYSTVDQFNHRDPDRYNERGNESRWNSISNPSIGMGALYNIASKFGYDEKSAQRNWHALNSKSQSPQKSFIEQKVSINDTQALSKPESTDPKFGDKDIPEKTRHDLEEAIRFLDNLSEENLSVKNIYHSEIIHFVALAQTYGFIAQVQKFFYIIKNAKSAAKNRITESKNSLTAPITESERKELNEILSISIDTLRKAVFSQVQELKQKQRIFSKKQRQLRREEQARLQAIKRQNEIEENKSDLAYLIEEYAKNPSEGLANHIRHLILDSCDCSIDRYTGAIKTVKATAANADTIFSFDPTISGLVGFDEFQQAMVFKKQAPWYKTNCIGREWTDRDDAELRAYLRRTYTEFSGKTLIDDWLTAFSNKNAFHAVKNYFKNLPKWDGTPRAETIFTKFLRVKDTPYAREVTMNWLIAAIARIFHPGCRYQTALVLHGAQGIGKSYVIERLGGQWYSAIIDNVDDPHAIDAIRIVWIGEFKEMAAMRKAELNAIKSFIERSEDNRRAAYERRATKILRHCVFVITVNDDQFLSDMTGNRRYMILHCTSPRLGYVEGLTDEYIQQVWAEVFQKYNEMFDNDNAFDEKKLALSQSAQVQAEDIAQNYMRDDGTAGEINAFLNTKIPPKVVWNLLTKEEHRQFAANGFIKLTDGEADLNTRRRARGGRHVQQDIDAIHAIFHSDGGIVRKNSIRKGDEVIDEWFIYGSEYRQHICAAEIFTECFGNDRRKSIIRIHEVLNNLEGWTLGNRIKRDPVYGDQKKVFYRDKDEQDTPEENIVPTQNPIPDEEDLPF